MPVPPRALFAGLVDDAALFPPGNAPMADALREHAGHRRSPDADLVGPFLCPVSRAGELLATLPADQRLDVSLVVDDVGATHDALRAVAADERTTLVAVEAAHARLGTDAATIGSNLRRLPDVTGFLEVPRTDVEASLDLVGPDGWGAAKYRTGGVTAADVPSPQELAEFLTACIRRDVSFKLTAGLHHAVRQHDATGSIAQHGVLDVLAAVDAATHGLPSDRVAEVLDLSEEQLAAGRADMTEAEALEIRRRFRSFGCCGVTEPIGELHQLGLLEA